MESHGVVCDASFFSCFAVMELHYNLQVWGKQCKIIFMSKLLELEIQLNMVIQAQEGNCQHRDETLDWERLHMASSARIAFLLALKRGADPELAACAACVHDFGRILTGKQAGHAEAGYEPVKAFLQKTALFTEEEIAIIAEAVKNHSRKTEKGTLIEEIVKDADVIDCYQYGLPFDRPEKEKRYEAWRREYGIREDIGEPI